MYADKKRHYEHRKTRVSFLAEKTVA